MLSTFKVIQVLVPKVDIFVSFHSKKSLFRFHTFVVILLRSNRSEDQVWEYKWNFKLHYLSSSELKWLLDLGWFWSWFDSAEINACLHFFPARVHPLLFSFLFFSFCVFYSCMLVSFISLSTLTIEFQFLPEQRVMSPHGLWWMHSSVVLWMKNECHTI